MASPLSNCSLSLMVCPCLLPRDFAHTFSFVLIDWSLSPHTSFPLYQTCSHFSNLTTPFPQSQYQLITSFLSYSPYSRQVSSLHFHPSSSSRSLECTIHSRDTFSFVTNDQIHSLKA